MIKIKTLLLGFHNKFGAAEERTTEVLYKAIKIIQCDKCKGKK